MSEQKEGEALKPCPFCNGTAIWRGAGGWCGIGCRTDKCPAYLHALMFRTSDEAEAVWNRRAAAQKEGAAVPAGVLEDQRG